jgi:hypothetical protein
MYESLIAFSYLLALLHLAEEHRDNEHLNQTACIDLTLCGTGLPRMQRAESEADYTIRVIEWTACIRRNKLYWHNDRPIPPFCESVTNHSVLIHNFSRT